MNTILNTNPTTPDRELVIDGSNVGIRAWGNNYRVAVGNDAHGMKPVELEYSGEVFGFLNALTALIDHPETFAILNDNVHVYASSFSGYAERAGYERIITKVNDLPVARWITLRNVGDSFKHGRAIKPVAWGETAGWSPAAREENRHQYNIVNFHDGLNLARKVMAGEVSVGFSDYGWKELTAKGLENKLVGFQRGKEYRDTAKEEKALVREIVTETRSANKALESGKATLRNTGDTVTVKSVLLEDVQMTAEELVGGTFKIVQANGSALNIMQMPGNVQQAAVLLGIVKNIPGAYLQQYE